MINVNSKVGPLGRSNLSTQVGTCRVVIASEVSSSYAVTSAL